MYKAKSNCIKDSVYIEIKLYRIGASEPVVKFEVIEKPNDWTKEVKKNESANETQQQRYDYWVAFKDYAFQNA